QRCSVSDFIASFWAVGASGEDAADDFFDGDFLNINVADGKLVQQGFANGDDPVAFYFELNAARGLLDDLAIFGQVLGRTIGRALTLDGDQFGIGKAVHDLAEAAIKKDRSVVDDNDAPA